MATSRRQPIPWQQKGFTSGSADSEPRTKPSSRQSPGFKYAVLPLWIIESEYLSSHAVRVFALMAGRWRNQFHDNVWPSHCTIAKKLSLSVITVRRAITQLVDAGAITSQRPRTGDNHGRTCTYTLHFESPAKISVPTYDHRTSLTREQGSVLIGERQNQTHITKPKEQNAPSSLKKSPEQKSQKSSHHHQAVALKAPDDDEVSEDTGKPDTCLGPEEEAQDHIHKTPQATARHLELFLGHSFAHRFVQDNGLDNIRHGLRELSYQQGLRNPVGWLVSRVTALKEGGGPLGDTAVKAASEHDYQQQVHRIQQWGQQPATSYENTA
ncbi:MAG: helix-turn-helix domain-containing protein [Pseudomonadota bacterium]|nr:helix-turn-helix domain-containing protein [Pseudomonadota bacterium]